MFRLRSSLRTALVVITLLETEHRALVERIRREAPELLEIAVAGTVSLEEVEQWTEKERFDLLEYVVFGDQLIAWHVGPSGTQVRSIFLPRGQLLEKIDSLNRTLVDPHVRFDTTLARQLYLFLIQPLAEFLSTDQLVVVPHDELYYLSFQVLQDPSDGIANAATISQHASQRASSWQAASAFAKGHVDSRPRLTDNSSKFELSSPIRKERTAGTKERDQGCA